METRKLTILAIDDHRDNLTALKAVVADAFPDARFLAAPNGPRGIELTLAEDPDVILLDIVMPGLDGFEVCRRLKADERLRHIPVVFLTALQAGRESRIKALEIGAEGFLSKPIDELELIAQIGAMAKIKAANQFQRMQNEQLAELVAKRTLELENELAERKRAEEALRLTEARFSTIFHASPVSTAVTRLSDSKFIDVNDAWLKVTGLTRKEVIGYSPSELNLWVNPGERDRLIGLLQEQSTVRDFEVRVRNKSGTLCDLLMSAELIELAGEQCVLSMAQDISERKRSEEELRESEVRFRTLIEGAPEAVFVQSGGRFMYLNPAMVSLLGASRPEELLGKDFMTVVAPECRQSIRDRIAFQRDTGKAAPLMEQEYLRLDGSRVPVETTAVPIRFQDSSAHLVFIRDITERKRSEDLLREREKVYRAIVEQAAEGILLIDCETLRFVEFNDAACHRLGYSRAEFAELTLFDLQGILSSDEVIERVRTSMKAGHAHFENQQRRKDGTLRDVLISNRVINVRGRDHIVAIWQDITERKRMEAEQARAEAQLKQAQKMEAIGTLAGGIAHDFNNILGIIIGYAEIASYAVPKDSQVYVNLDQVRRAARRATDLVRQILAFSRQSKEERGPVMVSPIVKEGLKLLRASLPSTIEIRENVELRPGEDTILSEPIQIHQVLMNLCTNAGHAMREKGGVLEVSLSDVTFEPKGVEHQHDLSPGPYLKLTISDTGHGIDPAVISRIFEPYFTTKEVGEGTGLGLAVVHGIVKEHGGAVTVRSELERGTTFDVFFPKIEAESEAAAEVSTILPGGTESILYVDDEPALVEVGTKILQSLDYKVTSRSSSVEALEAFRSQPNRFEMIITDQIMPHMTGLELAREILTIRPGIPIIICTGFSETVTPERAEELGVSAVVMKPLVSSQIAGRIRSILDASKKDKGR